MVNNTTTNANGHNNGAASDFIDFYQLLGADEEATTTALRRRINDLYTEAQSNRDHRNPAKRRRYEALCELLPYCRTVLLDPDKRARYDRYREQFQAGTNVPAFELMMDEIAGRIDEDSADDNEKVGLPGVEGDDSFLPATPGTLAGATLRESNSASMPALPREKHAPDMEPRRSGLFDKPSPRVAASRAATSANEPAFPNTPPALYTDANANANANAHANGNANPSGTAGATGNDRDVVSQRAPSSGSALTPVAFAVVALLVGVLVGHFLFHWHWDRSLLAGFVLGVVVYVLSNALGTRSKSGSKRSNRIS